MKIRKLVLMVGLFTYAYQLNACVIALTNDTKKPLLIVTDDFKEGIMLSEGSFVEFGSKAYMANFRVMGPNGKNFTEQYHVQQTACTPGKYTKLNVSEINPNNTSIPFKISLAEPKTTPNNKSDCGCGH